MPSPFSLAVATRPPEEPWAAGFSLAPPVLELCLPAGASALSDAGVAQRLGNLRVRRIAVCGGGTEHGVAATARDAQAAGFETWLLTDAILPERQDAGARAALELRADGVLFAAHDRFLVLNASARGPTALLFVEPLARWLPPGRPALPAWTTLRAALQPFASAVARDR